MTKSKGTNLAAILISALLSASAPFARAQDAHHSESVAPAQTGVAGSVATGKEADTAQQDMMGMMSGGMMPHRGMLGSRNMMLMNGMMAVRHLEGRLAFLKTELKITDEQTPQWNAFADTVRTNATAMTEMHQAMASQKHEATTLPDRLAFEQKAMSAHLNALNKTATALDELYAVLNSAQKKTADEIMVGPMGVPMGMM